MSGSISDISERKQAENALQVSEARFRELIETTNVIAWEVDAETFRFTYVSPQAERILRFPIDEWYSEDFWVSHIHPDDRDQAVSYCLDCIRRGEDHIFEYRMIDADGKEVWLRDFATVVKEKEKPLRLRGFMFDITECKRAEEALRESEKRIAGILELAPEAIISVDKEEYILMFNQGAEEIFGYRSKEVLGKPLDLLIPSGFREAHHKHIEQFISSSEASHLMSRRGEIAGLRKDGEEFPAEATITKLESGGETILTVILNDISERKKTEEHLRRTQKMEALGNLTGGVAHEFNNLLMAILGNLELINDEITDNESVRKKLSRAMESVLRGKNLTQQLLAYSRTGSLHPELTDLNEAVLRFCRMLNQALVETIEIKTKTCDGLWAVMIDAGELEGVLLNLAINARDAMPGGGVITFETANKKLTKKAVATLPDLTPGDYVTISVTDTGCGMSSDVIEHVFDPFFTTKEVGEGTGLGLSGVLGFVKQAGGTAEIESEPGQGTTVRLYLPKAKDAAKPGKKTVEETQAPPTGTETILYVEDDPVVLMIGITILKSLGYEVLEAKDGPSGLALLKGKRHIDLLLTDVVMPGGMKGTELAKKALALYPHLKVLLATGYSPEEAEQSMSDEAPLPIIEKPFRKRELAFKVREILDSAS